MPIKDLNKRREYQRKFMASKRLTENNVSLQENNVRPCSRCQTNIANWYHLVITEQEKNKLLTTQIHRLEKKLKKYEKQ